MSEGMIYPQEGFLYRSQAAHGNPISEDFGWRASAGGSNQWFLASDDGIITSLVDGRDYNPNSSSDLGNYYVLTMDNGSKIRCGHCLKGSFQVKLNQRVTKSQRICRMGNSGTCIGGAFHTHMTYWNEAGQVVVPTQSGMTAYTDTVIYEGQIDLFSKDIAVVKTNDLIGSPSSQDPSKQQIEVKIKNLRARSNPDLSASILGYVKAGFYDLTQLEDLRNVKDNGYVWYKVDDFWFAAVEGVVLHKDEATDVDSIILEIQQMKQAITEVYNQLNQVVKLLETYVEGHS